MERTRVRRCPLITPPASYQWTQLANALRERASRAQLAGVGVWVCREEAGGADIARCRPFTIVYPQPSRALLTGRALFVARRRAEPAGLTSRARTFFCTRTLTDETNRVVSPLRTGKPVVRTAVVPRSDGTAAVSAIKNDNRVFSSPVAVRLP